MMYLSSGVDMAGRLAGQPACVCVQRRGGTQGHCQGIRKRGNKRERQRERKKGEGERGRGMNGGVLNLPPLPPHCCPPTPPPSRLSEAGDRQRVGFSVSVCLGKRGWGGDLGWEVSGGLGCAVWRVDVRGQAHGFRPPHASQ